MSHILEICVDSLASARSAIRGGADRLELCSALALGGLTPYTTLLRMIREESDIPIRCLIRFHPNNRREDYAPFLNEADEAADSLEAFESAIDLCVVYNSTMYTDMIYKHIPVVRFKNGKTDLYPDLADKGFSSATELRGVLTQMRSEPESFRQSQELLYKQVFGASCGPDSYRDFYRDWGR